MPNINPDEIYHRPISGRLKDANSTSEVPKEEAKIISSNVEGSEEYEREKQLWREGQSVRLNDGFRTKFIFLCVAIASLILANGLYGAFLPVISYILYAVSGILAVYIIYYLIRQSKISYDSRKYKKQRKKHPTTPIQ
ncbi:hypothetical protein IKG06_00690 [Candidatus Saccharibacteria bacterium]|nr:hypothetical protein [Candidatus Saccharibacteria bacterium]